MSAGSLPKNRSISWPLKAVTFGDESGWLTPRSSAASFFESRATPRGAERRHLSVAAAGLEMWLNGILGV